MKKRTRTGLCCRLALTVILCSMGQSQLLAASEYADAFIDAELERAISDPDNSTALDVDQPIEIVFDALLTRLAEYSEDITEIGFDHSEARVPGEPGVGSLRTTSMTDGTRLVQRIILFDPPQRFAYFTDMSLSTVRVPIDYSIGYYSFSEQRDGRVGARVSVTYEPSSRLTAFLVRLGFSRALSRDFRRAEEFLNTLPEVAD